MKRNKPFAAAVRIFLLLVMFCGCGPSVENLGVFAPSRKESVLGQDGVTPIEFDDRILFWTFGDTLLGTWKKDVSVNATFSGKADVTGMISNSLAFTTRITRRGIGNLHFRFHREDGQVAPFIKNMRGERPEIDRLWAVDGIRIGPRLYVYYLHVKITAPGKPMGFRLHQVGLSRWDIPAGWEPGGEVDFRRLPGLFPGDYPAFGACVLRHGRYLYLTGQYAGKDRTSPVKIARVPVEEIENPRAYRFLGPWGRWVDKTRDAVPLLGDVAGECSLSYNGELKCFVMHYCQLGTGRIIMVLFRYFSELPGAQKRVVYTPPVLTGKDGKSLFYYSAKEIAAFERTVYTIYMNPAEYQPYLLRIDIEEGPGILSHMRD